LYSPILEAVAKISWLTTNLIPIHSTSLTAVFPAVRLLLSTSIPVVVTNEWALWAVLVIDFDPVALRYGADNLNLTMGAWDGSDAVVITVNDQDILNNLLSNGNLIVDQ
jgi:hypothetical protein